MPFLKNLMNIGKQAGKAAVPIIAGGFATALGGPAAGAAVSTGTKKIIGALDKGPAAPGSFTPSSAGDVAEARSGDRSRMKRQYGM